VPELLHPGVGMVTSLIRGVGSRGVGGALETLQLNTFVMSGVALASALPGQVCAVGKSMLLRRRDLERVGGFERLAGFLAEDQVCGQEVHALGLETAVSPWPVDNVLGRLSVRQFAARHLRWARIRRRVAPLAYASELLALPLLPAALGMVLERSLANGLLLALTLTLMGGFALATERCVGVRRNPLLYLVLEPLRELLVAALWAVPFVSSSVMWRGRRFRIGPRTVLLPETVDEPAVAAEWIPAEGR
jgi:ceramide glucosyltransferase